jgi:hypothetical protein
LFRSLLSLNIFLRSIPRIITRCTAPGALRPLQNVQSCSSSRKAKILTTGIYWIFRGLKFEPDAEIGQNGTLCKGLASNLADRGIVNSLPSIYQAVNWFTNGCP